MIHINRIVAMASVVVALAIIITTQQYRLNAERMRAGELALHVSNLQAARDSTRNVALENQAVAALAGDTLQVVEKRIVQVTQKRDALDRALGRERLARYAIDVGVGALRQDAIRASTQGSSGETSSATFAIRQEPYTIHASVQIPQSPDTARLSLRVALDPIRLTARITCARADANGMRSASIVTAAPVWALVQFDSVEQSPDLCPSPARSSRGSSQPWMGFAPVLIGAGRLIGASGSNWGLFVGSGIRFGR